METKKLDWLNIGLIVISLILAIYFPLRLFLFAYATLGPLHYLTEINWLDKKEYYAKNKNWLFVGVLITILVVLPTFLKQFGISSGDSNKLVKWMVDWSYAFTFIGIVLAIGFVYLRKWIYLIILCFVGVVMAIFLNNVESYTMIMGLMIPTVLHVYLFTVLFMLYGALKAKSTWGYVSVVLALIVPIVIYLLDLDQQSYLFPDALKSIFTTNNFHVTNTLFAKFMGFSDGTSFFFYETMELKILIFMAFIYVYHYLNWFSKTTVIGWHKNLTTKRTIAIGVIWVALVVLFAMDYKTGFIIALFFSFLHVFLELPLNVVSIKGIIEMMGSKK